MIFIIGSVAHLLRSTTALDVARVLEPQRRPDVDTARPDAALFRVASARRSDIASRSACKNRAWCPPWGSARTRGRRAPGGSQQAARARACRPRRRDAARRRRADRRAWRERRRADREAGGRGGGGVHDLLLLHDPPHVPRRP